MKQGLATAVLVSTTVLGCSGGDAAEASREAFGALADGTAIESVVLTAPNGVTARVITLGGILQSLEVPDRDGAMDDVVLGFDTAQGYLDNPAYMGATVGRYANRIADGRFTLDGETFQLTVNENGNQLHGGPEGIDKRVWDIVEVDSGDEAKVVLEYVSPDGEMGYPGTLTIRVTYALSDEGELTILHEATTDSPTIANITNHSYFNLAGQSSDLGIYDHELTLASSAYTPVNDVLIPTGEIRDVSGTAFDFRDGKAIRTDIHEGEEEQLLVGLGYDHNFVLDADSGSMRMAARLVDPSSGRSMEMWSDQPAIQFYSGNFLDGSVVGKGGRIYRQGDGLCLEPQIHPDAPNQEGFPSARLDPGETFTNTIVLRFGVVN